MKTRKRAVGMHLKAFTPGTMIRHAGVLFENPSTRPNPHIIIAENMKNTPCLVITSVQWNDKGGKLVNEVMVMCQDGFIGWTTYVGGDHGNIILW